jgi:hypothetical protein
LAPYNYGNKDNNEVKWSIKKKGKEREEERRKRNRRRKEMKERRKSGSRRQHLINGINQELWS